MGISPIEMSIQVLGTQDYSQVKHAQEEHPNVMNQQISVTFDKTETEKSRKVNDTEKQEYRYDESGKNKKNEYYGDGGRERRKEESKDGIVVKKNSRGFDVSV